MNDPGDVCMQESGFLAGVSTYSLWGKSTDRRTFLLKDARKRKEVRDVSTVPSDRKEKLSEKKTNEKK